MVRTTSYDKSGLKKGTWTTEEDKKLKDYVTKYGCCNWRQLPKFAGLPRCGKSCRLRWMNYLRPNVKRGNYSKEEEEAIIRLHAKLGNRWSAIAAELPGRSDNEIKNHWHTYLKKRPIQNMITSNDTNMNNNDFSQNTTNNDTYPNDDFSLCIESSFSQESEVEVEAAEQNNSHPQIDVMSCYAVTSCSTQQNNSEIYSITSDFSETLDSFWSEPFLSETSTTLNDDFTGFFDGELLCQYDNMFSSF